MAERRYSAQTLEMSKKSLDSGVTGTPRRPMLWVFVIAAMLLVVIIAVSLLNEENTGGHESELLPLSPPRSAGRQRVVQMSPPASPSRVYEDEDSNRGSWLLTRSVNPAVNACLDFRAYVCSGYTRAVGGSLEKFVAANTMAAVKAHFLNVTHHSVSQSHDAATKAVVFYQRCLESVQRTATAANAKALANFMDKNGLRFEQSDKAFDLIDKAFELLMRYDLKVFFALDFQLSPWMSPDKRLVRVVASPAFEEWKERRAALSSAAFVKFVKDVLFLCGVGEERITKLTNRMVLTEDHLTRAHVTGRPDDATDYIWRRFQDFYSSRVQADTYKLDLESSNAYRYFHGVAHSLDGSQSSVYLSWHVARHIVGVANLIRGPRSNRVQPKAYCYDQVYGEYKHAVLALYFFKVLNNSRMEEVRKMVRSITIELQKSIMQSLWMPAYIKIKLDRKVRRIRWRLGYPTGLSNWRGVDGFYARHPQPKGTFVEQYLVSRKARMRKLFALLRNGSALEEVEFLYEVPGIKYGPANTVSVPAVALVWPLFYHRGAPELNYGLLGSVLVEGMMRAFDRDNMMVDEKGSPISWSRGGRQLFQKNYRCDDLKKGPHMINKASKQPRSYRHPRLAGTHRHGSGRRPGVSVGAHALFRAYKTAAKLRGRRLRGFEALSGEQLFHVGRCLVACGDPHDATTAGAHLSMHRCNQMARHSAEFAAAFNCGGATSSKGRCDVW